MKENDDLCYPETSTHPWNLTHLQASLHVSDATVLTVTSLRTELIPQKAVKYAVRWKVMLFDKRKSAQFQAPAKPMRFENHTYSFQPKQKQSNMFSIKLTYLMRFESDQFLTVFVSFRSNQRFWTF